MGTGLQKQGRKLLNMVLCPWCRSAFPHRDKAIEHTVSRHGDYKSLRTRQEYLEFVEARKGDLEHLELAKSIPYNFFLSKSALQRMRKKKLA